MVDFRLQGDDCDGGMAEREPALAAERAAIGERASRLIQTIEGEVIPRLMLVHRVPYGHSSNGAGAVRVEPHQVAEFVSVILCEPPESAMSYVSALQDQGVSLESIYLDLLAAAARLLGIRWDTDESDFMQVTLGLRRLQELAHQLSPAFTSEIEPSELGRRVLLVPVPGDQHTFGSLIVAEFMRRAGWDVWDDPAASRDDIIALVQKESFSVVGLSVSCDARLEGLSSLIRAIRRSSRNKSIGIMVGGRPFVERPEQATLVGADVTASDGKEAVAQAQHLLALLADRV
jgi:methanogenic corrinoid protein MtbC1